LLDALKNELDINVEPASPADFIPVPDSALSQSRYVGQFGRVSVYYYHLPSLVIAKVARGLEQDFDDAERFVRSGEISWDEIDLPPFFGPPIMRVRPAFDLPVSSL